MASAICTSSGGVVIVSMAGDVLGRALRRLGRVEVLKELLDAVLARDRFVEDERQLGDAPQAQLRSDLTAEERRGAAERAPRLAARLLVAERGVEDAGLLQIRADL